MTTLSRQTPRSTSKQPLREVQILHDEPAQDKDDALGWAEVQALIEDCELEAASYLRTLSTSRSTSLSSLTRHFTDTLSSLDPRVREMPLARFVGEFGSDAGRALRGVVEEEMRVREAKDGAQGVLASARKRKRVLPLSPRQDGQDIEDPEDTDNPFLATASAIKHKKLRQATSAADLKGKGKAPGSVRKAGGAAEGGGTARKTRLRLRPSTTASSSANANFVYRTTTANPVPPTPLLPSTRQPRRGESIVLRSLNDSPLGEFVASSLSHSAEEEGEDGEDGEEGEGEGEWDLVGEGEASRVEHLTPSSRLRSRSPKKPKSIAVRPPTSTNFNVPLPPNAPSFEQLKVKWVEEVRDKLRAQAASEGGGVGEEERRRLEEVLMGLLR
ncbi:hypothetical protein NBRC10512_005337 [Rhodotorula toruloides]|uniref:RHTO0S29e01112g1_1 n=2 Tax=Rhodotorula toruloides TaxID=5286 RepID=A0A061BNU1_RHOTO|nr:uncharacterized protein RHTO_06438 [Rhodotorula toruloides NP11]EMS18395.1 hypothetical protein RHTO_06438 [Rhodotorula toruloides NP11]CDR49668.1 RHTO0S29e01112g1_1 [Rhodotorula toruloides]